MSLESPDFIAAIEMCYNFTWLAPAFLILHKNRYYDSKLILSKIHFWMQTLSLKLKHAFLFKICLKFKKKIQ